MSRRNTTAAGALLFALGLALPGCTVKIEPGQGGLPVVTAAIAGPLKETETLPPRRIEVGDAPTIVVDNRVGRVAIKAGDAGAVVVEGMKRAPDKDELAKIQL